MWVLIKIKFVLNLEKNKIALFKNKLRLNWTKRTNDQIEYKALTLTPSTLLDWHMEILKIN